MNPMASTGSKGHTVMAVPTITSLNPSSGTTVGGNSVVIKGTNFTGTTAVTFDLLPATPFTVDSPTQITATAPAHAAGAAPVVVTNGDGPSTTVINYTYTTGVTVSPNAGTSAGGNTVTIIGTNLLNASKVMFGLQQGTIQGTPTSTTVSVKPPAGSGVVPVTVTTPGGTSSPTNYFYVNPPTKTSLSTSTGGTTGGTATTISGTNLSNASGVTVGGAAATITSNNAGSIGITTPAGTAGNASIVVTTPGGSTDGLKFTYVPLPVVGALDPTAGTELGGTVVTITGSGFTSTTAVDFGPSNPAPFTVVDDNTIQATSPSGTGDVNVTVTTPAGTSVDTATFTYTAPPGG
jgi:IPT/TIG domain